VSTPAGRFFVSHAAARLSPSYPSATPLVPMSCVRKDNERTTQGQRRSECMAFSGLAG
jgi:hypothetical protein